MPARHPAPGARAALVGAILLGGALAASPSTAQTPALDRLNQQHADQPAATDSQDAPRARPANDQRDLQQRILNLGSTPAESAAPAAAVPPPTPADQPRRPPAPQIAHTVPRPHPRPAPPPAVSAPAPPAAVEPSSAPPAESAAPPAPKTPPVEVGRPVAPEPKPPLADILIGLAILAGLIAGALLLRRLATPGEAPGGVDDDVTTEATETDDVAEDDGVPLVGMLTADGNSTVPVTQTRPRDGGPGETEPSKRTHNAFDEAFHLLGEPQGDDFGNSRDKAILEVFYGGGLAPGGTGRAQPRGYGAGAGRAPGLGGRSQRAPGLPGRAG